MNFKKLSAVAILTTISLVQAGSAGTSAAIASNADEAITVTVSGVSISGRVKSTDDRAIRGAVIQLKDASTNQVVKSTISSNFGYYKIENIDTGRAYVLTVTHKRYLFALPSHLLEFAEDRANMDFIGEAAE